MNGNISNRSVCAPKLIMKSGELSHGPVPVCRSKTSGLQGHSIERYNCSLACIGLRALTRELETHCNRSGSFPILSTELELIEKDSWRGQLPWSSETLRSPFARPDLVGFGRQAVAVPW